MSALGDLYVKISGDMKPLKQALSDASAATKKWANDAEQSVNKVQKGFTTLKGAIGGALAVGAAVKGFQMVVDALDRLDKIDETARKVGVTAERLQELQYAAKMSGSSAEDMTSALEKLNVQIGQAQNGTGKLDDVLTRYGITLKNTDGSMKSTEQVFNDIVKLLGETANANERAAIEAAAFGKEAGPNMDIMLREGTAAIEAQAAKARELGLIYSNEMAAGAADAKDKVDTLKQFIEVQFTKVIADNATSIGNWAMTAIGWIGKVIEGYQLLGKVWDELSFDKHVRIVNQQTAEIAKMERDGPGLLQTRKGYEEELAFKKDLLARSQAEIDKRHAQQRAERELKNKPVVPAVATSAGDTSGKTGATETAKKSTGKTKEEIELEGRLAIIRADLAIKTGLLKDVEAIRLDNMSDEERASALVAERMWTLNEAYQAGVISLGQYNELLGGLISKQNEAALADIPMPTVKIEEATTAMDNLRAMTEDFGMTLSSAFEDAIVGGGNLKEIMNGLVQDMLRMTIRALILKPLMDAIFGAMGIPSTGSVGAKAGGGVVNGPTVVGERGPELLIPQGPSRIVNNHAMRSMGGAPSFKVEVTNKTSAPAAATQSNARFDGKQWVVGIILEDLARGGQISNGLGSTYGMRRKV